jgi:hypothetical protein
MGDVERARNREPRNAMRRIFMNFPLGEGRRGEAPRPISATWDFFESPLQVEAKVRSRILYVRNLLISLPF